MLKKKFLVKLLIKFKFILFLVYYFTILILKNKNKNIIPIAIGIDSKYVFQAVVFITSLLENKKNSLQYGFTVEISIFFLMIFNLFLQFLF